jgi:hypothetical protein
MFYSPQTFTEIISVAFPHTKHAIISGLKDFDLIFVVLTPLPAVFQLYHGNQF